MNKLEILKTLYHFNSSDNLYKYQLGKLYFNYTDGIKFLVENVNCFWLLDIILSYQSEKILQIEYFQVWKLIKYDNS